MSEPKKKSGAVTLTVKRRILTPQAIDNQDHMKEESPAPTILDQLNVLDQELEALNNLYGALDQSLAPVSRNPNREYQEGLSGERPPLSHIQDRLVQQIDSVRRLQRLINDTMHHLDLPTYSAMPSPD